MALQIAVSLWHRNHYSEGRNRKIFGYEAFDWGFMIMPKEGQSGHACVAYDATDSNTLDPATLRMTNPTLDWRVRTKTVDPHLSSKLLGSAIVADVPVGVSTDDLHVFFYSIPPPVKNRDPQQSCVTWAVDAPLALQKKGWVQDKRSLWNMLMKREG